MDKNTEKKRTLRGRIAALFGRVRRDAVRLFLRIRDRKTHIYRACPICKHLWRLPRIRGEHEVNCPECHGHFSIKLK